MVSLKLSAALMWSIAVGFGMPTPFVASHLLREGKLPMFMNRFPAYGGGFFERLAPNVFVVLLALFAALSALEFFTGWLLWQGQKLGGVLTIGLLPIETVFWLGFAVPIPPIVALARIVLLVVGWSALR